MDDQELNFARTILQGRPVSAVSDDEVLREAERLLGAWQAGQLRMERPKLYDHYALIFSALLRKVATLEARLEALENLKASENTETNVGREG